MDLVRIAIAAIVAGAASGGTVVCLVLAIAHGMARGPDQPFAFIAVGGAVGGLMTAGMVAFFIGRPLGHWRTFAAAVSAVAGAALVTILTLPVDLIAGRIGLFVMAALGIALLVVVWRMRTSQSTPG